MIADYGLEWGTSRDKAISFWVKVFTNRRLWFAFYGGNYSYPFVYNISSANTWEKKTITVTGPTSGGNVTLIQHPMDLELSGY